MTALLEKRNTVIKKAAESAAGTVRREHHKTDERF